MSDVFSIEVETTEQQHQQEGGVERQKQELKEEISSLKRARDEETTQNQTVATPSQVVEKKEEVHEEIPFTLDNSTTKDGVPPSKATTSATKEETFPPLQTKKEEINPAVSSTTSTTATTTTPAPPLTTTTKSTDTATATTTKTEQQIEKSSEQPLTKRPKLETNPPKSLASWNTVLEIIEELEKAIREKTRLNIRFDTRHKHYLQDIFERKTKDSQSEFWSCVDSLFVACCSADFGIIREDARFIQSLIRKCDVHSIHRLSKAFCEVLLKFVDQKTINSLFPSNAKQGPEITTTTTSSSSNHQHQHSKEQGQQRNRNDSEEIWSICLNVLEIIKKHIYEAAGRRIVFDERHKSTLKTMYTLYSGGPKFWSVFDFVSMKILFSEWSSVKNEVPLIQSFITQAIPSSDAERIYPNNPHECINMLLTKINKSLPNLQNHYQTLLQQKQQKIIQQQQPIIIQPPQVMNRSATNTNNDPMAFQKELEKFYSWSLAENVLDEIENYLSNKLRTRIVFDSQHRDTLRVEYHKDVLGFWSILDLVMENILNCNFSLVRNQAKFIQMILIKNRPSDKPLSSAFVSIFPQHPQVPIGMPPHVALQLAKLNQLQAPHQPPIQLQVSPLQQQQPQVQQQQSQVQPQPMMPNFTWDVVSGIICSVFEHISKAIGIQIIIDQKLIDALYNIYADKNQRNFIFVLDKIREILLNSNWRTISDRSSYIYSIVTSPNININQSLSPFIQSILPQPQSTPPPPPPPSLPQQIQQPIQYQQPQPQIQMNAGYPPQNQYQQQQQPIPQQYNVGYQNLQQQTQQPHQFYGQLSHSSYAGTRY